MLKLERYIRPYWGYILLTVFIKLLGAVFELMIPWLMEIILDHKVPEGNLPHIYLYGFLMLICAFLCLAGNVIANRMSAKSFCLFVKGVNSFLSFKSPHSTKGMWGFCNVSILRRMVDGLI